MRRRCPPHATGGLPAGWHPSWRFRIPCLGRIGQGHLCLIAALSGSTIRRYTSVSVLHPNDDSLSSLFNASPSDGRSMPVVSESGRRPAESGYVFSTGGICMGGNRTERRNPGRIPAIAGGESSERQSLSITAERLGTRAATKRLETRQEPALALFLV